MWRLNIHEPERDSYWVELKPGPTSIGRSSENNVPIADVSASRRHAEIILSAAQDAVTIRDLNSTNGTYVNHKRITTPVALSNNDNVRIGQAILNLTYEGGDLRNPALGTHLYTREMLLESLDEHAVLIDDVARKLNAILDVQSAVTEIITLLKRILNIDSGEVLLANQFASVQDTHALEAIRNRSAKVNLGAMYIPIIFGDELQGLICMFRKSQTQPFSRPELGLAIAISHQAALTIQRMQLLERVRREEQSQRLLLRFVSPTEAEYLLKDYLETGKLPELTEQKVTVLFSDIANSTGLAERLGVKHFASILNSFYNEATQIVFRYGGMIKYLGDGILAIFTDQGDLMPTEEKAVIAGRELIGVLNRTGSLDDALRIIVGVSINTGPAMVGYVGTKERAEFNVIGDVVNVAFRMQEYARPYKILIGPVTAAVISAKYRFRRVGIVRLRGREKGIQAYEVLP
jgi:adenylate cyclase